jgi:transposase
MKVQDVLLRAMSGTLSWMQAAEILGWSERTVRRWRFRYLHYGYDGLWDRRKGRPSPRRAPSAEVERILRLYRERYAGFNTHESTATVMVALEHVLTTHGLPMALYTDRAHWAFHTPTAGAAADRSRLTQVGRALQQLGIEHIPAYSPQARGRGERLNRTLQDRLVNELRVAGIRSVLAANRYLRERFLPTHNARFTRPPADPASAFVPLGRVDLAQITAGGAGQHGQP